MEFACLACVGLPAALCLFVLLVREMQSGSLAFAPLRRVLREKRFGMLTLLSIPAVAAVDLAILRAMGLAKRLDAATVLAGLFIGVPSLGIVATFWFFVMDLTEEGALVLLRKRDALRDEATPFGKAQTSPPDTKLLYGEAAAPIIATIVDEPVSSVTEEPRMSQVSATSATGPGLSGRRVFFAGKLAAMARRDAQRLVRQHGGEPVEAPDERVDAVVVGEGDSGLADLADLAATGRLGEILPAPLLEWAQAGRVQVVTETQFWRQLGLVEGEPAVRRLHTPGMLASLLSVSIDVIRRWHRRGLIVPAHTVRRLAYFDFQEVATAKRLTELLARGISPSRIERQLAGLARIMPGIERPLAQLSVIVEGRDILLRHGGGLVDAAGQLRMDFSEDDGAGSAVTLIAPPHQGTCNRTDFTAVEHSVGRELLGQPLR
ncbi:MAG: MerR family transcriptional regulator [Planctomycetia bacterium]|nr:MerR family transcriptional regulator [Planctomycetia bacterium]